MIISYSSTKPYDVTPQLNRLDETVQMSGHNICFYAKLIKIIPTYHQILLLSSALLSWKKDCQSDCLLVHSVAAHALSNQNVYICMIN